MPRRFSSCVRVFSACVQFVVKELIGLLKVVNDSKIMGAGAKNTCYIEVMRHLSRRGAQNAFPAVVAAARPLFDSALVKQFATLQRQGLSWERWLEVHKGIATLLLNPDDLEAVLLSDGQYTTVAPQLSRLHAGSMIGAAVFGFARNHCASKAFQLEIEKSLQLVEGSNFSVVSINAMKKICEGLVNVFETSKVAQKREIELTVLGVTFTMEAQNARQEYEWRLMALVRCRSLGYKDGLPLLPCERPIVEENEIKEKEETKVLHRGRVGRALSGGSA